MSWLKYILLIIIGLVSCSEQPKQALEPADSELLFELEHALTEAIVQDAFSPPVASRIYAYCNLAAQEVVAYYRDTVSPLSDHLNGFGHIINPIEGETDERIVMAYTFGMVANSLIYRDHVMDSTLARIQKSISVAKEVEQRSIVLAQSICMRFLCRTRIDRYDEIRKMGRYVPLEGDDKWEPTPPKFTDALEPHWGQVQPFTMDSAAQFYIPIGFDYSLDPQSSFYSVTVKEVYDSVMNVNDHYRMIARFWDCNPFLTNQTGHLTYNVRQLTPGGHWIGITEIACRQIELDIVQATDLLAKVSVAMADAFISAWHAKYETDFIRPETYINRHIDPEWKPLLESPHFPEYTSAHSTVSAAAAYVLTQKLGEGFHFTDTTEVAFGLPAREFDSFFQASDEASLSRIIGGIHFRPAIEVGMDQGRLIGAHVLSKFENQ